MTINKTTSSAILAATLVGGIAAGRLSAPVPSSSAHPVAMRWLDEGSSKPNRYAIALVTKIGSNTATREIVCEADGSEPKLNGVKIDYSAAATLCNAASSFGKVAIDSAATMAVDLTK